MTLLHPVWLLLAIPLGVLMLARPMPGRWLQLLRGLALFLIIVGLSGLAIRLPSRAGTVVVVADRSLSMPHEHQTRQLEIINQVQAEMSPEDRLAVVSFGGEALVEQSPQAGKFGGFVGQVRPDGSDLARALETAVALIPPESPGRVMVLSDGRWTGTDPAGVAGRAASRRIAVDYRLMERSTAGDLAIQQIDAPSTISPGESFMLTAWVRSPIPQEIQYQLLRGNQVIGSGSRSVTSGVSRLTFRDKAGETGALKYQLQVASVNTDPVPENNRARVLVGVEGPKPILCATANANSGLVRLLQAGGLEIAARDPADCNWGLEDLADYSAVILENLPAEKVGVSAMSNLALWVRETGSGLMMTGGRTSYGPGGYFKSPLEPIMPVSMELRREHRKLSLAIVVAMDRSGSMAAPVADGKCKMDLANLAAVEVLDLLSPLDEYGVVAVDSSPHVVVNLQSVTDPQRMRQDILRIDSMGGGIFVYVALEQAASMIAQANAGTRHIILFADAADSEEPGNYVELIRQLRDAQVTVSVIGLGSESDCDAPLLKDIARRGDGRCFFTDNPYELPRLFAQDTFVVARSTFVDQPTAVKTTAGLLSLTGKSFDNMPAVGGYNLCYLRPEANLAAVTTDEYAAPVVASWQVGAGRALCYTGECDGQYTGPVAGWPSVGEFFASLARWTAGEAGALPENMLLTQRIDNGLCRITLHLDPERESPPFSALPVATVLRSTAGQPAEATRMPMAWDSADTLTVAIPLTGQETALTAVEIEGLPRQSLPPVCLPYCPEYAPAQAGRGLAHLDELARITGGKERINLAEIWNDLPAYPRIVELGPYLLILAVLLLLTEVFERRTGLLSAARLPEFRRQPDEDAGKKHIHTRRPTHRKTAATPAASKPDEPEPSSPQPEPSILDAFEQARQMAKRRRGGGH